MKNLSLVLIILGLSLETLAGGWPNLRIGDLSVRSAGGEQSRLCFRLVNGANPDAIHCSDPFPYRHEKAVRIIEEYSSRGELEIRAFNMDSFSLDDLYQAIHRITPLHNPEPCRATQVEIIQEPRTRESGERYFHRSILIRNFQFSGSESVNESIRLDSLESISSGYLLYGAGFRMGDQRVILNLFHPANVYEGLITPQHPMTVRILDQNGSIVDEYRCPLQSPADSEGLVGEEQELVVD